MIAVVVGQDAEPADVRAYLDSLAALHQEAEFHVVLGPEDVAGRAFTAAAFIGDCGAELHNAVHAALAPPVGLGDQEHPQSVQD